MVCRPCGASADGCAHRLLVSGRPCCVGCRHTWAARVTNTKLPLWLRVVAYAETNAGPDGRCTLARQQLHHGVEPTAHRQHISRAIKAGVKMGLLEPESSARCLVLVRGVYTPEVARV